MPKIRLELRKLRPISEKITLVTVDSHIEVITEKVGAIRE